MRRRRQSDKGVDKDTAKGISNSLHAAYDNLLAAQDERMRRLIAEMDKFVEKPGEEQ